MVTFEELSFRLVAAMDWREPRIPSALVAKRCDVTPQAVSKWRREGKIDLRQHLANLAAVTQVPPMFYMETKRGESPETRAAWKRLRPSSIAAALTFFAILPALKFLIPLFDSSVCVLCKIAQPAQASA